MIDEYSITEQLNTTGFNGYIILFLLLVSVVILILSWVNFLWIKNEQLNTAVLIILPMLLIFSVLNFLHHAWLAEQQAQWWAEIHSNENIPQPLFLAGYHTTFLVAQYTSLLAVIICIGYIPWVINKLKARK
ncbi:MAG: hypothetical protein D6814_12715 [Calditrichaeota bacterium]|nr:MAG: hypothetical protein D6814_12715 [Calditrichota bacterium]